MRNILTLLPFYILILMATLLLCCMGETTYCIVLYPLIFFYFLTAYFIRYYVRKILPYYLLHLGLILLSLLQLTLTHNPIIIGFCLLSAVVMFIYGHNYWISDELSVSICLNPVLVIAGFFAYLFTLRTPDSPYPTQMFVLCVLYILFSNLGNYVVSLGEYEQENRENDSISLAPVLKKNTKIVCVLFIALFIFAFLANSPYLQAFFQKIFNAIGTFIRDLLARLVPDGNTNDYVLEPEPSPSPSADIFYAPPVRQGFLGKILTLIFDIITNLILFAIFAYPVYRTLKRLFSKERKKKPISSSFNDDGVLESRKHLERPKTKSKHLLHRGPADKIRRQYYKTIQNYQKHGYTINPTHTPSERATDIHTQYTDDLTTLTKQYEQARYKESKD